MGILRVKKKDGSEEDFDKGKITAGVIKSGASEEEAEKVVQEVEIWANTVEGGVVSTDEIAAKVVESLLGVNLKASTSFEEYRKTKTSESN
ncbi:hypothetical protein A2686_03775 [Candidatus Woesebacteria bacterium RIFCSPHIGHO2_01_FULL_38_10]|uniref:ATP-cone domain-containing protein n=1 Tax=Candidatus Woesebacteria bacterium RIFCSPLOWO2_01_FULL_39_10b TaxID=1802517 RepID=A0A1F8B768_9BACT|nr:MAG: hypothetical protein A2686_03775 [Candidatus Woesebacteria bacterium RIFCSPHIGHO2_01_FULL_38_10]OGM59882.1 MAG: hypothetical protein A2892_02770 [Candidatus Woesebacteria bacterium RIFCSPLOWO2_01_FULL_39_10b]